MKEAMVLAIMLFRAYSMDDMIWLLALALDISFVVLSLCDLLQGSEVCSQSWLPA